MCVITRLFLVVVVVSMIKGSVSRSLILGESVTLYCPVHSKSKDLSIKSITWLKDGEEFYKYDYSKKILYPMTMHNTSGVKLREDSTINGTKIVIGPVTFETAGKYKCVVELFNPHFKGLKFNLNVDTVLGFTNRN